MKERLHVMVSYFIALAPIVAKPVRSADVRNLTDIVKNFSVKDGEDVVRIEKTVNHDLKALELYFTGKLPGKVANLKRFILFGLGSEDINSIAFARLVRRSREEVVFPELYSLTNSIAAWARKEKDTIMIARTHGLPAGLTTFGKELSNPLLRLCDEITECLSLPFQAKLTGEVGSVHGLSRTGVKADWLAFGDRFISSMGVGATHASTQIAPYDSLIRYLHSLHRINTILIDLCKNMWLYVLLEYIRVVKKDKEVGSSGMPHKVNPIYFEGAEGGLEMANGIIETLARTLMVNRLQRDFSDSTLRRNTSLILAYSLLSYQSIIEAFGRLEVDKDVIATDITVHAEVWIEPIKILMLLDGQDNAFELLKQKTRGKTYTTHGLLNLVGTLQLKHHLENNIHNLILGKIRNPYPSQVVDEAVVKAKKLHAL
jgi:adenylosuccinate lyase